MRIEKRYLALGHDIDADTTPLEAGLDFAVAWETKFIGREALLRRQEQCLKSRVISLILEDGSAVPIGGEPLYLGDVCIGQVTSASFGHRVGKPVAIGSMDTTLLPEPEGARLHLDIAREFFEATASLGPVIHD